MLGQKDALIDTAKVPVQVHGFVIYLQKEYERRRRKNENYSLRAFARNLGIGSSDLSKIMSGRRAVTTAMIKRLSRRSVSPYTKRANLRDVRGDKGHHAEAIAVGLLPLGCRRFASTLLVFKSTSDVELAIAWDFKNHRRFCSFNSHLVISWRNLQ